MVKLCAVCIVQSAVSSVQCAVPSVQGTVCSVQFTVCSVQVQASKGRLLHPAGMLQTELVPDPAAGCTGPALADLGNSQEERESLARALHSCPRRQISMGKPEFPYLSWSSDSKLPPLASLVSSDSWTLFDRLGLEGTNVRMEI